MKRAHALMPEVDPRRAEVAPGMAELEAQRFVDAQIAFTAAGDAPGHRTQELSRAAWKAWQHGLFDEQCRNVLAAAHGLDLDSIPIRPFERPGATALPGVIEGCLDHGGAGEPRPLIALPCLAPIIVDRGDGPEAALQTIDMILCDPARAGRWRPLTGTAGVLGWPGNDPEFTDEPGVYADPTVRLHRRPLDWWRDGGTDVPGLGGYRPRPICVVDWGAPEAAELLTGHKIVCDDAEHAAEVHDRQQAQRRRLLGTLAKAGPIFVAQGAIMGVQDGAA